MTVTDVFEVLDFGLKCESCNVAGKMKIQIKLDFNLVFIPRSRVGSHLDDWIIYLLITLLDSDTIYILYRVLRVDQLLNSYDQVEF